MEIAFAFMIFILVVIAAMRISERDKKPRKY